MIFAESSSSTYRPSKVRLAPLFSLATGDRHLRYNHFLRVSICRYYFDKPSELYKEKMDTVLKRITVGEATLSQVDWRTANNTMVAAAKAGDVEGITRLLQAEKGVAGVDFDRADANGVSPVMWAAWKGHSAVLVLSLSVSLSLSLYVCVCVCVCVFLFLPPRDLAGVDNSEAAIDM